MADIDESGIVYSFRKNASELVCAGLTEYKGKPYFFLRIFTAVLGDGDAVMPTPKGMNLPLNFLPEIIAGVDELKNVMATEKLVKTIRKASDKEIRIGVSPFKGNVYIYVRIYKRIDDEFRPTKKGISIAVNKYDELVQALETLHEALRGGSD